MDSGRRYSRAQKLYQLRLHQLYQSEQNSVDIVFSDGAVARIKPTFINADGRESSTYIRLCSLLTNGHTNFC